MMKNIAVLISTVFLLPFAIGCDRLELQYMKEDSLFTEPRELIEKDPEDEPSQPTSKSSLEQEWLDMLCCEEFTGRKAGTQGNFLAYLYLESEVAKMGFSYNEMPFRHTTGETLRNLIITIEGDQTDSLMIVGAHFDGQYENDEDYIYPAANDNASGVVTTLSILDSLSRADKPRYTTIIAFWDGEEGIVPPPFKGSQYFVTHLEDLEAVILYINIDAMGHSHDNTMILGWYADEDRRERVQGMVKKMCKDGVFDYTLKERCKGEGGSDYRSFGQAGIPYISYTDITLDCDHPQHSFRDTKDAIDIDRLRTVRDLTIDILNIF